MLEIFEFSCPQEDEVGNKVGPDKMHEVIRRERQRGQATQKRDAFDTILTHEPIRSSSSGGILKHFGLLDEHLVDMKRKCRRIILAG